MTKLLSSVLALSLASSVAFAGEQAIGEPIEQNGMEIAAVYLQPIDMEPKGIDLAPSLADIHLEADIHAIKGNAQGFGEGEWIPYLKISYELKNKDNGKIKKGTLMPMVASDGPHYGANIALPDMGTYTLELTIHSPEENGYLVHTDAETGPGGTFDEYFKDGNLVVSGTWDYVPIES